MNEMCNLFFPLTVSSEQAGALPTSNPSDDHLASVFVSLVCAPVSRTHGDVNNPYSYFY
jgi:hypothetical protein